MTYLSTKAMAALLGCNPETLRRNYRSGLYKLGTHCVVINPKAPPKQQRLRWNSEQVLRTNAGLRAYRSKSSA
ncbi:hypothetical protein [Synechococcus elongatus]|uniref:hypothetical protein n=1 Tax=Synechococcus elongatus TaxID=32046 RepID=UPI000039FEFE|nr:hypothetical protein [Synechococcus elongatus]AJD58926.1 hypothetical protein M744_13190 [Synechococcus elongatus UTEX 2973]MBD2588609.1 hypothetical protein [Synechococcus elongatus FACHB-242]MBD2689802.1 hypothetical protein [Synechococcus elongatus FACHB-1061]MBD2708409.1 hypothetical protein [Synechococcus elongatus PCC 7942 = FACHB-805]WKW06294.1 hypothetical protein QY054_03735 [Synechococcus elongatus PCC 7942 = FACHB-805]